MVPSVGHSGKGKTTGAVKGQWLPGIWGKEGRERWVGGAQRTSRAVETILWDTVMLDIWYSICATIHKMHQTKIKPWCKLWSEVNSNGSIFAHQL